MKQKVMGSILVVLLLSVVVVTQVFASGSTSQALLRRTATRTATKAPTVTRTPTKVAGVTGSVLLQNGACCVGGPVGTTVNINATFSATSSAGTVTEMRVARQTCTSTIIPDLSAVAWEPFVTSKTYPTTINAINWTSSYINVQYRDSAGNISPVYCDDISVEGMPAVTGTAQTGTPTLTLTVTKTPTPLGAEFTAAPLSGTAPLTVQFNAISANTLSSCTWTFGDGTGQTFSGSFVVCPSTTHVYTTAGSYSVSLTVNKAAGGSNSITKPNYIQVTGSSATLTPTPTRTPTKTPVITGT